MKDMSEAEIKCLFDVAGVKYMLRRNDDLIDRVYDVLLTLPNKQIMNHDGYFKTPAEAYMEAWLNYERHVGS